MLIEDHRTIRCCISPPFQKRDKSSLNYSPATVFHHGVPLDFYSDSFIVSADFWWVYRPTNSSANSSTDNINSNHSTDRFANERTHMRSNACSQ